RLVSRRSPPGRARLARGGLLRGGRRRRGLLAAGLLGLCRAARPAAFGRRRCRLALRRQARRGLSAFSLALRHRALPSLAGRGLAGVRVAGGLGPRLRHIRLGLGVLARLVIAGVGGSAHLTLAEPACPRKMRVGANSPSLWPTIASLMK